MIENAFQRTPDKNKIGIAPICKYARAARHQVLNEPGIEVGYLAMQESAQLAAVGDVPAKRLLCHLLATPANPVNYAPV